MKVIVDRKWWRFGGESEILFGACGFTMVRENDKGFKDIIGFIAAAAFVPKIPPYMWPSSAWEAVKLYPELADALMDANDRKLCRQTPAAKEGEILDLLRMSKIEVEFVGEYHPAVLEEMEETRYDVPTAD